MDQRRGDPRATGAQRMTQRNGAPPNIHMFFVNVPALQTGENLRGECLVEFDQIDVFET